MNIIALHRTFRHLARVFKLADNTVPPRQSPAMPSHLPTTRRFNFPMPFTPDRIWRKPPLPLLASSRRATQGRRLAAASPPTASFPTLRRDALEARAHATSLLLSSLKRYLLISPPHSSPFCTERKQNFPDAIVLPPELKFEQFPL